MPAAFRKPPEQLLVELQQNLKAIHEQANSHAKREQGRYVRNYNLKSCDKQFVVGQQVIVLLPDTNSKLMSRWQGSATVIEIKSPYSYLIELDGDQRRVLHANKLRPYRARVNDALISHCAIVYDADEDFGSVPIVEGKPIVGVVESLPSQRVGLSKLSHLNETQRREFLALLDEFADCFAEQPGLCKFGCHEINVTDDFKPKQLRPYRVPEPL